MNLNDINTWFKLPVYYNGAKASLNHTIVQDLELVETHDASCTPLYSLCFRQDNDVAKALNPQLAEHYTTDVAFLKDSQQLLKTYTPSGVRYTDYSPNYKHILDLWNELKGQSANHFKEKFYFVEQEWLEFLNRSEWFLQFMSVYNLLSPIISLIVPILILILPFFILKLNGIHITIAKYIETLKEVASQNAIGKLFVVDFTGISVQEKATICVSAALYLFSIYQNFMVCARFNANMKLIHHHFNELRIYLQHTLTSMDDFLASSSSLVTFASFNQVLTSRKEMLQKLYQKIVSITDYNMFNLGKIKEIGYVFKCFYELHVDTEYHASICYSLGFHGFLDCLKGVQHHLAEGKIQLADFSDTKTSLKGSYYLPLKDGRPVKNDVLLKKNYIVTGPNASGKTTVLKSTLVNLLLTQQFGCGFYDSATIQPFQHFHCYLNIPDTSGRDSLFQAEARRCKDILDSINTHGEKERHFCVFDELYSGTNPEEAEQSAIAFMKYVAKKPNVVCMLTTHFSRVCKRLHKHERIQNHQMVSERQGDALLHTYTLAKGISAIKGGAVVLKQLNYPREILDAQEEVERIQSVISGSN